MPPITNQSLRPSLLMSALPSASVTAHRAGLLRPRRLSLAAGSGQRPVRLSKLNSE